MAITSEQKVESAKIAYYFINCPFHILLAFDTYCIPDVNLRKDLELLQERLLGGLVLNSEEVRKLCEINHRALKPLLQFF